MKHLINCPTRIICLENGLWVKEHEKDTLNRKHTIFNQRQPYALPLCLCVVFELHIVQKQLHRIIIFKVLRYFLVRIWCPWTDRQRRGLSVRSFRLQLSAVMVQRHWQDVASSAHFLPLQGRQRDVGDGDGEGVRLVGGCDGGWGDVGGGVDGGGRVGGAWVLDGRKKRGVRTVWLDKEGLYTSPYNGWRSHTATRWQPRSRINKGLKRFRYFAIDLAPRC